MRRSMKIIIVCGEVLLFGLLAVATARAIEPTRLATNYDATISPYAADRPVRVTMTNKLGQVTTLEYRQPVKVVSDRDRFDDSEMRPINELPVLSSPARAEDFDVLPTSNVQQVGYQYQANYTPAQSPVQVRYAQPTTLPVTSTTQCVQPPVVTLPPTTTYSVPNYSVPVTGVPQTVYRPQVPLVPVVQSNVQVGAGLYGQPVIYRPGQPVRNAWRWLTP